MDAVVAVVLRLLHRMVEGFAGVWKIKAVRQYVLGIQKARRAFITGLLAVLCLLLAMSGFLVLHVGLFLWLPWSTAARAAVLVGLGLVYVGLALGVILRICSERTWMRFSRADELVRKVTR